MLGSCYNCSGPSGYDGFIVNFMVFKITSFPLKYVLTRLHVEIFRFEINAKTSDIEYKSLYKQTDEAFIHN